jgi:hypothetical protein
VSSTSVKSKDKKKSIITNRSLHENVLCSNLNLFSQ